MPAIPSIASRDLARNERPYILPSPATPPPGYIAPLNHPPRPGPPPPTEERVTMRAGTKETDIAMQRERARECQSVWGRWVRKRAGEERWESEHSETGECITRACTYSRVHPSLFHSVRHK